MDTEKIRSLLRVIELGSLSAAAEELGYTPSGMSRSIASLEEETGLALLERERRGVRPTAACEELLGSLRRVLGAQEQLEQAISAVHGLERGRLRIGCSYGSYFPLLARTVAAFSARWPGIEVEILPGTSSELGSAVAEGRADLALISRREGEFEWIEWKCDELVAVLPEGHPLAAAPAFPLARFAGETFIEILPGQETDNSLLFRRLGVRYRKSLACGDALAALTMVEAGLGVTLVNALLLENWHGRTAVRSLEPPQFVAIGVACAGRETRSPAAARFLSLLSAEGAEK